MESQDQPPEWFERLEFPDPFRPASYQDWHDAEWFKQWEWLVKHPDRYHG